MSEADREVDLKTAQGWVSKQDKQSMFPRLSSHFLTIECSPSRRQPFSKATTVGGISIVTSLLVLLSLIVLLQLPLARLYCLSMTSLPSFYAWPHCRYLLGTLSHAKTAKARRGISVRESLLLELKASVQSRVYLDFSEYFS
jgi:hypothetical protein